MIDIKILREDPEKIQKASMAKGIRIQPEHILEIDAKKRELVQEVQKLREERNANASGIKGKPSDEQLKKGQEIKNKLDQKENALRAVEEELNVELFKIPNPAKMDVKVGKDESSNEVIKKIGEPRKFEFKPKDHLELAEALDIIDMKRASKVSGARFAYLKGDAVLLELALIQFALNTLIKEGFIPVLPPALIKTDVMKGLGYMENGGEEDMFHVGSDGLTLVGTAEHAIVPMFKDEVLKVKDLPMRLVGFSPAFRREAGSYGKDTRGILRVHQFDKVEMISFVKDGDEDKEHDFLLSLEEKLYKELNIPYQVVKMCTGDLGFPASRKFDLEAWMPGQDKYREVTSVSTIGDFQSRRLNIKYQDGDSKEYASILNGTGIAMGRTIIAILENYQEEDGSIKIPDVLQGYMGGRIVIAGK